MEDYVVASNLYKLWLDSPYGQVHADAKAVAERKRLDRKTQIDIWQNILNYLDYEDVFYPDGRMRRHDVIKAIAAARLKSHWNYSHALSYEILLHSDQLIQALPRFGRDVEQSAFTRMIETALVNYGKRPIASKQQTLVLMREARRLGKKNVAEYVAYALGVTKRTAEKRIAKTNSVSKSDGFSPKNDIIKLETALQEQERHCIWCNEPTPRSSQALCKACEKRFYFEDDYPHSLSPEKLRAMVNKSNADYQQMVLDLAKAA